jgi:hypothetical protein
MVHDPADVPARPASLDSVAVRFDEQRLVSDAGLLVCATLAERLGVAALVNDSEWLRYRTAGAAMPGRKVMSLVHGMLAGADRIDQMTVLRAGSTSVVLGHRVMAPSTLGTFCGRSPSGMCASLIVFSMSRSRGRGRGRPVPARARGCRW